MATPLAAISAPVGITNNSHLFITQYNTTTGTRYAVGNDIITKNVIAKDDKDGKLKITNSNELFKDAFGKVFKYVGENTKEIYSKILDNLNKEVPDDFLYTTITNKNLLDDDQINFDDLFEEVNYTKIQESINTPCHSLMEEYRKIAGISNTPIPLTSASEISEAEKLLEGVMNVSVCCHPRGYYAQNDVTGMRTGYYSKISNICVDYIVGGDYNWQGIF